MVIIRTSTKAKKILSKNPFRHKGVINIDHKSILNTDDSLNNFFFVVEKVFLEENALMRSEIWCKTKTEFIFTL